MKDCLFCKFVSGEFKTDILYEDESLIAVRDINPQAPIHLLLIPKKHIPTLTDAEEEDRELLGSILLAAVRIAEENGISKNGFRVVNNTSNDGGQTVYHIHFHLLGGRQMKWPPG